MIKIVMALEGRLSSNELSAPSDRKWPVCDRRGSAVATSLAGLHLSLLGDLQRVVNLDSEVSDRAFEPMSRGT